MELWVRGSARHLRRNAFGFGAALVLGACSGGGGGSSSPPPPPPPPPANVAPTAVITTPTTEVEERQSIVFDASGSTDSDGDTLSFSWEQLSGPAIIDGATDGAQLTISVPALTQSINAQFRVSVSDGQATATADQVITGIPIVRTPIFNQWANVLGSQPTNAPVSGLFAGSGFVEGVNIDGSVYFLSVDATSGASVTRTQFADDGSITETTQATLTDGPVAADGPFELVYGDFGLDTQTDVVILSESSGKVWIYRQAAGSRDWVLEKTGEFDIPGACSARDAIVGDDRPAGQQAEFPGLLIGSRGGGLTALLNEGNPRGDDLNSPPTAAELDLRGRFSQSRSLTTTGTFCELTRSFAVETGRFEIVEVLNAAGTSVSLGAPVALNIANTADLDVLFAGQGVGPGGQRFLAVVVSDHSHHGRHELIIAYESGGTFQQEVRTLANGVPSDLFVGTIDRIDPATPGVLDVDSDIVIAVEDTPFVTVFVNTSTQAQPIGSFSGVGYFDVGFGIGEITLSDINQRFGPELIAGNSASGQITVYRNVE